VIIQYNDLNRFFNY